MVILVSVTTNRVLEMIVLESEFLQIRICLSIIQMNIFEFV